MRIVLDTNCLLAIIPKVSPFRLVFDAFRFGQFELAVSSEILLEYQEIAAQKMTPQSSDNIIELLLKQPNTIKTEIFYRWQLITADPDDNKFTDTAISSGADYLITNDSHFRVLRAIPFPKVIVLSIQEFATLLQNRKRVAYSLTRFRRGLGYDPCFPSFRLPRSARLRQPGCFLWCG